MLSVYQKKAVLHVDSSLLVAAGPGCGKTKLIIEKILFLLEKNTSNENILTLTKSRELSDYISKEVNLKNNSLYCANTFFSFCFDLVEKYSKYLPNFSKDHVLLDDSLKLLFFFENIDEFKLKSIDIKDNLFLAKECISCISELKQHGCSLDKLENVKTNIHTKVDIFSFYLKYEEYKNKNKYFDCDDIFLYTKKLFENEKIIDKIKKKYAYILIDDSHLFSSFELELILKLSLSNITFTCDNIQVYDSKSNILTLLKNQKDMTVINLLENFRSSSDIVDLINITSKNISGSKELIQSNSKKGDSIEIIESNDEFCELGFLVETIQDFSKKGKSIGVFTRNASDLKQISRALNLVNISHRFSGIYSFNDSTLVSYVINMLTFLNNPKEESIILFSLLEDLNIRSETLKSLSRKSSLHERSLFVSLKNTKTFSQYKEEQEILKIFLEKITLLLDLKSSKLSLSNFILKVITIFNLYKKSLLHQNSFEISSLNAFLKFSNTTFGNIHITSLPMLLKLLSLDILPSFEDTNINLNIELSLLGESISSEYDIVFLPFLNQSRVQNRFKSSIFETQYSISREHFSYNEKKRLYSSISIAKEKLFLSYVKKYSKNNLNAKKSKFLDSINLKPRIYAREFSPILINSNLNEDKIIKEIYEHILNKNFLNAKKLIDYLSSFNSTSSNLHSFIHENISKNLKDTGVFQNSSIDEGLIIDPKKMVYSVSQLKTYEQCPKKYLYQYIYKIPSQSKHYFDFGTSMHSVLEEIQPFAQSLPLKELQLRALGELSSQWISKSYISAEQEREYYEKGIAIIRSFFKKEKELYSHSKTISLEKEFWLTIGGKRIMGYIDRIEEIDGKIQVLDYKTSNSMEMKSKLKENIQLYVYALALLKKGLKPQSMGLWYLIHDQIDLIDYDETIAEKIKKYLLELISQIEKGIFIPKPTSFNCTYCDFSKICISSFNK